MEIPNSGSPPVNGLVEKAEKLQVSIALGKGKKQKKESLSAKQQRSKSSCHFDSFIAARDQVGVSFISEETEGRDSLAVGSSRRGRKLC